MVLRVALQNDYADLRLAGKTGTTNDARDTWFVGIDGKMSSTIWLGRDDNGETRLTGASGALQIYKDYLNRVVIEKLKLGQPSTIKWVGINATVVGVVVVAEQSQFRQTKIKTSALLRKQRVLRSLPRRKPHNHHNPNNLNHQTRKCVGCVR